MLHNCVLQTSWLSRGLVWCADPRRITQIRRQGIQITVINRLPQCRFSKPSHLIPNESGLVLLYGADPSMTKGFVNFIARVDLMQTVIVCILSIG